MHELSIANALIDRVHQHTPPGARVHTVDVQAGPLQAIDPVAMQWAWRAATNGSSLENTTLNLTVTPYTLHCSHCAHQWQSDELFVPCPACHNTRTYPLHSNDITLLSLHVTDPHDSDEDRESTHPHTQPHPKDKEPVR